MKVCRVFSELRSQSQFNCDYDDREADAAMVTAFEFGSLVERGVKSRLELGLNDKNREAPARKRSRAQGERERIQ